MRHNILIPTDFSENAWHALKYAIELYKFDYANFYILNVFPESSRFKSTLLNITPEPSQYQQTKLESENGLSKILKMIALIDYNYPKHHFETFSFSGNIVEAIKNVVEEKGVEIVIMGKKGKSGFLKTIYGKTAIYIMENMRNCPLLLVPEKAVIKLPKEIVFPTSFKTALGKQELNHLIEMAWNCKASVEILHISQEDQLDKKQICNKQLLNESFNGVSNACHTLSPMKIATAINCFVESRDSDLVAFICKKNIFSGNKFSHPIAKRFGYNYKLPVMVMHDVRN
jgi:nucleotide-binding universal stress UspA family protein